MLSPRTRRPAAVAAAVPALALALAACSSGGSAGTSASTSAASASGSSSSASAGSSAAAGSSTAAAADGACPAEPIDVVVSVDQWGDIVESLAGECAEVHTVLASSSVDPHDYEPTSSDATVFDAARLVVVNGADYDPWASKIAANAASSPAVVDAGKAVGAADGANPHLWYSPEDVQTVAQAVTDELSSLSPDAADYFAQRHDAWEQDMQEYTDLVAKVKAGAEGRTYAATESVFDYTAQAVGLTDATPEGFAAAAANESDPTPNDVAAFQTALQDGSVDVLVYNTQTEGSIPEQVRTAAEQAGVPVVEVTETVAPGADSFEGWQLDQLRSLADALGIDA